MLCRLSLLLLAAMASQWPMAYVFAAPLRTVVLSGQQVPGPSGSEELIYALPEFRIMLEIGGSSVFRHVPLLNLQGDVAFVASSTGDSDGSFRRDGIWTEHNGTLNYVAGTDDSLPNADRELRMRSIWGDIVFNDRGEVAFHATTADQSNNTQNIGRGIWAGAAGSLRNVATNIQPLSGSTDQVEFHTFTTLLLNNSGQVAFNAQAALPGSESPFERLAMGAWSDVTGSTQLVALEGQTLNLPSGQATLSWPNAIAFTEDGSINIFTHISAQTGGGIAFLRASEEQIRPVVSEARTLAVGNAPIIFSTLDPPTANTSGGFVFGAAIGYQWVLAASHDDKTRIIAVEGEVAPGTDKPFQRFDGLVASINSAGRVAFKGALHDHYQTYTGIWTDASGILELAVRAGDMPPGADPGQAFLYFSPPQLNARGDIAFMANLIGTGIDAQNDEGIWARDSTGMLQLIAREGDLLEVAPDDYRQIATLAYGGDYDNAGKTVLNDAGQLVFAALFTDGTSGIFVASLGAIPEPKSAVCLLIGVVLLVNLRSMHSWRQKHATFKVPY